MLPKQAITYRQLRAEGLSGRQILAMSAGLKLFPTPFKGIYYVPLEEERKGGFIEKPMNVLAQAVALYLGTREFYFSCRTAEEARSLGWQPSGSIHIVNGRRSRRIILAEKVRRNQAKRSWRARKVARILQFYGMEIVFHKTGGLEGAKARQTPYGRFALPSQIWKDERRFGEEPCS